MQTIRVGLLGLGNVGSGVVKLLSENAEAISRRLGGARVEVKKILVREAEKKRAVDVPAGLLTTRASDVLDDPEISIIVELIGGETVARELVLQAIHKKRHVVTANKALLAKHGEELFAAAEKAEVDLYYEASVCGGVPLIRALREGLASDRIVELIGIVNGTSNYLLTTMTDTGRALDDVLKEAQNLGYAEADSALDVDGWDAAHKLAVLVPLCFRTSITVEQMLVEGLRGIEPIDFRYAERFGCVIKPLVIAKDYGDSVEARVHPALIPERFMLASVGGVFNAVYVSSQALGQSLYYGRGAGMMPTAVAVVSDLIEVSRNALSAAPARGMPRVHEPRRVRQKGELESRYYLRFGVADRPGVLAQLAGILAEYDISISEVVQEAPSNDAAAVPIVMTTHFAKEQNVQEALTRINSLPSTLKPTRILRIFERREGEGGARTRPRGVA